MADVPDVPAALPLALARVESAAACACRAAYRFSRKLCRASDADCPAVAALDVAPAAVAKPPDVAFVAPEVVPAVPPAPAVPPGPDVLEMPICDSASSAALWTLNACWKPEGTPALPLAAGAWPAAGAGLPGWPDR